MTAVEHDEMKRVGSVWWYSRVLKRHRRLIWTAGAIGLALGLTIGLLKTRQYTARARFRAVATAGGPQSALSALGAQFGLGAIAGSTDAPELYVNVLRSRDLLRELGRKQYAVKTPPFAGDLYAYFKITEGKSAKGNLKLIDALQKRIKTTVDRTTGIVTFELNTGNAELSEAMAVSALDLLNEFDIRRRTDQARAEREFVERRLAEERHALAAEENALTSFYTRNRQILAGRGASPELAAEESRLQRRVQLSQQVYLALAQNLARAQLEESRNTPIIALLERPEGFVEPQPRGTLRLMAILAILGVALAGMVALVREYWSLMLQAEAPKY